MWYEEVDEHNIFLSVISCPLLDDVAEALDLLFAADSSDTIVAA